MRYIHFTLTCIAILCSVAACNAPISYDAQKEARRGLDTAVRQIPSTSDFTVIKIVYREFYNNEDPSGKVAYFARAFFVISSSISPATLARDTYAKKIQDLGVGWAALKDPPDPDVMLRGEHEMAVISLESPGEIVDNIVNIPQLRLNYPSVIFLKLEYVIVK